MANNTVVYRGGDAFSGWMFASLRGAGFGLGALAWAAFPFAAAWIALSFWLGRKQARPQG
jgi:AAA family ATP:ADP antiporter